MSKIPSEKALFYGNYTPHAQLKFDQKLLDMVKLRPIIGG